MVARNCGVIMIDVIMVYGVVLARRISVRRGSRFVGEEAAQRASLRGEIGKRVVLVRP